MISSTAGGSASEIAVGELSLPDVAQLRQFAYRLFAALFLYPETARLDNLSAAAVDVRSDDDFVSLFPFSRAWLRLLDTLAGLSDLDRLAIEQEYRDLFQALAGTPACPPFESFYRERRSEDAGQVTAQLIQRYRGAGLTLASPIDQSPDHVVVELEFMAFLCRHEDLAWSGMVPDNGIRALKRQRAFLRRHLAWWFPMLAGRISTAAYDGFYARAAQVAEAFIHHDADLVELLITHAGGEPAATGGDHHAT